MRLNQLTRGKVEEIWQVSEVYHIRWSIGYFQAAEICRSFTWRRFRSKDGVSKPISCSGHLLHPIKEGKLTSERNLGEASTLYLILWSYLSGGKPSQWLYPKWHINHFLLTVLSAWCLVFRDDWGHANLVARSVHLACVINWQEKLFPNVATRLRYYDSHKHDMN